MGRTRAGAIALVVVAGWLVLSAVLGATPGAARSAQLTDAEVCDLTPGDGNWARGVSLTDGAMSIVGIEPFQISVPEATAACSNQFEYSDGSTFETAVYQLGSEAEAISALEDLRSAAGAAAPVEPFARDVLGDEAWIASFEFDQLAFTRVGAFLVGGHSNEANDFSRGDYTSILIERMGIAVSNLESGEPPGEGPSCAPQGTVTDHAGAPMPGLRVQLLLAGENVDQQVTDGTGWFQFAEIDFFAESYEFDSTSDRYEVLVVLRDAVEGIARFDIRHGPEGAVPKISRGPFLVEDDPDCVVDFALGNVDDEYTIVAGPDTAEEWRGVAFAYQGTRRAHQFAVESLGVDLTMPLPVYTYCEGNPPGVHGAACGLQRAYFRGGFSSDPDPEGPPFIAMSRGFSRNWSGAERPINGEYHEFGHAFMADAFGGWMPHRPDHVNHAGYVNPTSTDSWTEGFAEWFASQVYRHVDGARSWWLYPVRGQVASLEDDRKVADNDGQDEELAIAGVLVDMVDGDSDYEAPTRRQLTITNAGVIPNPESEGDFLVAVEIRNDSGIEQRDIAVKADFGGVAGLFSTRVDGIADPEVLAPGDTGVAIVPVPPGAKDEFNSIQVVAFGIGDDDDVTHSAREVWEAIAAYRSNSEHSAGNVMDASELYEALIEAFPGEADAIDAIFVNHGIFADIDPRNEIREASEPIGVTSPDGTRNRNETEPSAVFDTRIDTGATDARAFVQVLYPEPFEALDYAYRAVPDPDTGMVSIAVPPASTGAVVRIVLRADAHLPVVLPDIEADAFWRDAEANRYRPFLEVAATMTPGDPFADSGGGGDVPWPLLLVLAGLGAAGAGVFMRSRRRLEPPPPPPPPPPPA